MALLTLTDAAFDYGREKILADGKRIDGRGTKDVAFRTAEDPRKRRRRKR